MGETCITKSILLVPKNGVILELSKKYINVAVIMKRIITRIGDIFCVEIGGNRKRYFQYIANDLEQLNSSVIRVFKTIYDKDADPGVDNITSDQVDFYSHTVLKLGILEKAWIKVGKSKDVGSFDSIMFRSTNDYSPSQLKSYHWYVWKLGQEESTYIGELTDELASITEDGGVFPYTWIIERMKTGRFPCAMPY